MTESFRALCSDFYVNQKLSVKLELPRGRETVLDMCERLRRQFPSMDQFKRYEDELALETASASTPHRWMAVRSTNIRSGIVNPANASEAYDLHREILQLAPYFLSISPLDIEYVELLFGFDLECRAVHDRIIHQALIAPTELGELFDLEGVVPVDCQPVLGYAFGENGEQEVLVEVKSRSGRQVRPESNEPISIYLTVRRVGPFEDIKDINNLTEQLAEQGEALVHESIVPKLIKPIRDAIGLAGA